MEENVEVIEAAVDLEEIAEVLEAAEIVEIVEVLEIEILGLDLEPEEERMEAGLVEIEGFVVDLENIEIIEEKIEQLQVHKVGPF